MELLPSNVIVSICNNLDVKSLHRLARTSSKYGKICKDILNQKKLQHMRTLCSTDTDLITFESWQDIPPKIFIRFSEGSGTYNCYESKAFMKWINDMENTFALWIPHKGLTLDSSGRGGGPDLNETYVKLYTQEFVLNDSIMDLLKRGLKFVSFDTDKLGQKRLGNLEGDIRGISRLHGQSPGYMTWKLSKMKILHPRGHILLNRILKEIEEETELLTNVSMTAEDRYFISDLSLPPLDDTDLIDPSNRDFVIKRSLEEQTGQIVLLKILYRKALTEEEAKDADEDGQIPVGQLLQIYVKCLNCPFPPVGKEHWEELSQKQFQDIIDDPDIDILIDEENLIGNLL